MECSYQLGFLIVLGFLSYFHQAKPTGRICNNGKAKFLPSTAHESSKKLSRLRSVMRNRALTNGGIHAYVIPSADAHQSEDIAPQHKRREYISGFSGSHGQAVVTLEKAALWTDGRYFLQAEMELDCNWILQKEGLPQTPTLASWLAQVLKKGSRVGVDPFLVSVCEWNQMNKTLSKNQIEMVPLVKNLVDKIWTNRPLPSPKYLTVHEITFADDVLDIKTTLARVSKSVLGKSWEDKIHSLRNKMRKKKCTAVVLQALDEIAWLFNLRGSDIEYSPVFFSYSVITTNDIMLFVDQNKLTEPVKTHLRTTGCKPNKEGLCVRILPYTRVLQRIKKLIKKKHAKIWINPSSNFAIQMVIPKEKMLLEESPVALPKAIKNAVEIQGMINANRRDAVAISEFFYWLEKEVEKASQNLTEMVAERKLYELRKEQEYFTSLSFPTISGFGANSAVIHYKANNFTNARITKDSIYLLDSGGQYKDGTTDTTRTVHFGTPTAHQKDCFTRVLKGHIDIAKAVFPNDTYGRELDVFAREPLWEIGLDYRHGTGHGIGHFLNVHEGPQCIAPGFPKEGEKVLFPGMIQSDEPGYYEEGEFGIRHETAVIVVKANTQYNFDGMTFLKFEPVIYLPFQRKLIETSMLTPSEIAWLNEYIRKTRDTTGEELRRQGKENVLEWLLKETEPLPHS